MVLDEKDVPLLSLSDVSSTLSLENFHCVTFGAPGNYYFQAVSSNRGFFDV